MIIWTKVKKDYFKNKESNEFNSKKWISIISKRIKKNFIIIKNRKFLDQFISSSLLPILILNEKKKKIKILDFGSGSQEIYFQLNLMNIKKNITIDSIEVEKLTNYLKTKKFYSENIEILFFNDLNFKKKYDYFHISDSLQYLKNWRLFLKKINRINHKYIILNNIPAGKNKSYITKQVFYGKEIQNNFFSINEIQKILYNFEISFSTLYLNKIRGEYRAYPQDNFEKKDRINYPKTLIFKNKMI